METRQPVFFDTVPGARDDLLTGVVFVLLHDGVASAVVKEVLREARRRGDTWPGEWLARRRGWLVLRDHWREVKCRLEAAGYAVARRGDCHV
jgi:hypothetical protein